ncbi:MAG TPA: endonuclease III domain-containing protein [Candidatus Omnitrophota bacterium]|nr:endonuclease III domain-containing protein [Candidatus Omnitrophota bacterium]
MNNNHLKEKIGDIYQKLYRSFGPQSWWPGDTPFEVIAGAILTQNTNWQNVAKAIDNLKKAKVLTPKKLHSLPQPRLAELIRPSGYFNIKATRLKEFLNFLFKNYGGSLKKMFSRPLEDLRKEILSVKGIGPETADSILLYAGGLPVFVVDAYTKRIFSRQKLLSEEADYHQVQELFTRSLKRDVRLYNEYHALIVRLGKDFCKKTKPRCEVCPIK